MGAITSWSASTFLKTILAEVPTNNLSSSLYQPWFNGPIHRPRVAIRNALLQSTSFEPSIRCWIRSPATYSVVQVPVLNRSKCFFMRSLHILHIDACFRVLRERRVEVVCRDIAARFDGVAPLTGVDNNLIQLMSFHFCLARCKKKNCQSRSLPHCTGEQHSIQHAYKYKFQVARWVRLRRGLKSADSAVLQVSLKKEKCCLTTVRIRWNRVNGLLEEFNVSSRLRRYPELQFMMAGAILRIISRHGQRILSSSPFTKYLFVTNIVVGGAIDFSGDLIAQKVVEKSDSTDWRRTGRMVTVAVALCVPGHFWYVYLDRRFPLRTLGHIVKKVLLDVFVAGPPFLSAFYLGTYVHYRITFF